jgi:DNA helicase HerA-like ATPase
MKTAEDGRGIVNILAADELMSSPRTYAAFMLWLLSELFEQLPEVGDVDKPKLVFFFDEAHLLFSDLPQAMQEKVEQVVRLIRSKGVGVYFVSQNPLDIPDKVLGQLGNRVQHALRAFTPRDQKAVKSAAETFRANPKLNVEEVISQLGVGEALVSLLEAKGTPAIVERAFIAPPVSQLEPLTDEERKILIEGCELFGKYEQTVDRESAYEVLHGTTAPKPSQPAKPTAAGAPYDAVAAARARAAARQTAPAESPELSSALGNPPREAAPSLNTKGEMAAAEAEARLAKLRAEVAEREAKARAAGALADKRASQPSALGKMMESAARSASSQAVRSIVRGVLGSIFGGRR